MPATLADFGRLPYGFTIGMGAVSREVSCQQWLALWPDVRPQEFHETLINGVSEPLEVGLYIVPSGAGELGAFYKGERLFSVELKASAREARLKFLYATKKMIPESRTRLLINIISVCLVLGFDRLYVYPHAQWEGYYWARMGALPTDDGWKDLSYHMSANLKKIIGLIPTDDQMFLFQELGSVSPLSLRKILSSPSGNLGIARSGNTIAIAKYLMERSIWEGYLDLTDRARVKGTLRALGAN